jgi:predicted ATPase
LAEALGKDGQIDEALDVLAQALDMMQCTRTIFHCAELHRLRGEFLLRRAESHASCFEAEASFRKSLAVARQQQAKSLEFRAVMSLARLMQKQGRYSEAGPILAECYAWFAEGFDTTDLLEATALLKQLS